MKSTQLFIILLIQIQLYQIQSVQYSKLTDYVQYLKHRLSEPITYYAFVREWPATVCKQQQCDPQYLINYDGKDFNMHGLWPSGKSEDPCFYPAECLSSKYDETLLDQNLLEWMNKYYTGLYNDQQQFRSHEFEKHGTCYQYAQTRPDLQTMENIFFNKIKQLNEQYNLVDALASRGIYPSDSESYSVEAFVNAIKIAFGNKSQVSIQCLHQDNKQYITSIEIDFDPNFNLIENPCHPQPKLCNQQQDLWFPVFQQQQLQQIQ